MTESELKELDRMIGVMESSKTKLIQFRARAESENNWRDFTMVGSKPSWDWKDHDYRVKPEEPRRAMVSVSDNGKYWTAYDPATEQRFIEQNRVSSNKLVEFIELTPEVRTKLGL